MITPKPNKYKKLKVPMTICRLNIFKFEFCKFLFTLKNSVITGCKFCNREKKTVIQKKKVSVHCLGLLETYVYQEDNTRKMNV